MQVPNWHDLELDEGILVEPVSEADRLVFWLPGEVADGQRSWQRISNIAGADVVVDRGLCFTAAASLGVRQRSEGLLGRGLRRFLKAPGEGAWLLPDGSLADYGGQRRTDLILVWGADGSGPADEPGIRSRWPEAQQVRPVGPGLFLVYGVNLPPARADRGSAGPRSDLPPDALAERRLEAARAAGDRRAEALALTDLGAYQLREGDPRQAVGHLEVALQIARSLGSEALIGDALIELGLASLAVGDPHRAQRLVDEALWRAYRAGDRFGLKRALDRCALALSTLGDPAQALAALERALDLARELGDRRHESYLLWYIGIQQSELGRRDLAVAAAQAAVELMEAMGNPEGTWYADHLRRYRQGAAEPGPASPRPVAWRGKPATRAVGARPVAAPPVRATTPDAPGLLRMAASATKAMARFIGSGLRSLPAEAYRGRLDVCRACAHHTGQRCRLCGCFTYLKARLIHEPCPLNKWPL